MCVVMTGGPCAGKTSAMAHLRTHFEERGIRVYFVPEAATLFFRNGSRGDLDLKTPAQREAFQINILRTQMHLEDTFRSLAAASGVPSLIVADRGTMDGRAYCSEDEWSTVLEAGGFSSNVELRDARYDAVLHLVTAADGAPSFYKGVAGVRLETPEEARELDQKTLRAWSAHPAVFVFKNDVGFASKMRRVCARIGRLLGVSTAETASTPRRRSLSDARPPLCTRKWRLASLDLATFASAGIGHEQFDVTKVYLTVGASSSAAVAASGSALEHAAALAAEPYCCVRARTQGTFASYNMTRFDVVDEDSADADADADAAAEGAQREGGLRRGFSTKRILSKREYAHVVSSSADPGRVVVKLKRTSFIYDKHFYKVS